MTTLIYGFEETGSWSIENDTGSWSGPDASPRATMNLTRIKGKLGYDTESGRAVYGSNYPGTAENILELDFTIDTTLTEWPYAYIYQWNFEIQLSDKMKCIDTAGLEQYTNSYLVPGEGDTKVMYAGNDSPKVVYTAGGASSESAKPQRIAPMLNGIFSISSDGNTLYVSIEAAWVFGTTVFPPNTTNVIISTTAAANEYGYGYKPKFNIPGALMRNGDQLFEFGANSPCVQNGVFAEPLGESGSGVNFYDLSYHPMALAQMNDGTVYKGKWDGTFYRYWE